MQSQDYNISYTPAVRTATALKLSVPSFAEALIGLTMIVHANVLGFLLAPLMLIAFVSLIAAVAMASKNHEHTSRNTWTWLALAAVAQILTFVALAAVGKGTQAYRQPAGVLSLHGPAAHPWR